MRFVGLTETASTCTASATPAQEFEKGLKSGEEAAIKTKEELAKKKAEAEKQE